MRVLHVITSLRIGGAEKLMVDILPIMKANGVDVELLLFDGAFTPFRQKLEDTGIKVYDCGKGGSVYSPIKLMRLIPYLKRYDIIHTHNTAPQLFAAIGSLFCPVVLCTTEHSTSNRRRRLKWYAPIDKWMYSKYKTIICCSAAAKTNFQKNISPKLKCIAINNGVDVCAIEKAKPIVGFRDQFPQNSRLITMVAGFRWEKDQDTLINALLYLDPRFHVILVGDGVRKNELIDLTRKNKLNDRVHFLGLKSDIPGLLKSSDFIVMSSHFEGLSLSSVEGLSVGKPMIASDVDGLKQVIKGAGLLFKEGDPEELARIILTLDNDNQLYRTVSEKCLERAKQFDISKMVEGYLNVYYEIYK